MSNRRKDRFGPDDIGDLTGRTAVVTGANSGVGFETALELAAHGAHVILACRNTVKADEAGDRIVGNAPGASVETLALDLSALDSVRSAAAEICAKHARIDVLVNNAGLMGAPFLLTEDGFELQMATNHLGPFAFTGLLLPTLLTTMGSRVVTVSSTVHRAGRLDPVRMAKAPIGRNKWLAYCDTKLSNLAFTGELQARLVGAGERTQAMAAHPGWSRTGLLAKGPLIGASRRRARIGALTARLGQTPATGALPSLYAAVSPDARGGHFYGPRGIGGLFGAPEEVRVHRRGAIRRRSSEIWKMSEELTGVHYPLLSADSGPDTFSSDDPPLGARETSPSPGS